MNFKTGLLFILLVMLPSTMLIVRFMAPVEGAQEIIKVPGDLGSIQAAINAANPGDIIQVASGVYNECITVNKRLTLVGDDSATTIINSNGTSHVVYVEASYVNISGFTIQNGMFQHRTGEWSLYVGILLNHSIGTTVSGNIITTSVQGIFLQSSNDTNINNNVIVNNQYGIALSSSDRNIISDNTVSNNIFSGIDLQSDSDENVIRGNTVSDNKYGVYILGGCDNNTVYHNNVINNPHQARSQKVNMWDNGYPSGGNYWSDYTGNDTYSGPDQNETGSDGIGDTPYVINDGNQDRYPLMYQWPDTAPPTTTDDYEDGQWHNATFTVTLTATDNKSGVKETYYKINNGPTKTVSTDGQPLITTENANNTLEYWSIDNAGNEEIPHKNLTNIKLDKTKPSGYILINNNDTYTTTLNVTLDLWANDTTSGVSQMRLSNDGIWDTESWEAYSPTKAWTLSWDEVKHTIYVQYQDVAGLVSPVYNDTITLLDENSPTTTINMSGVEGNNGWYTSNVTVTLNATDDISGYNETKYSFDNATWTTYTTPFPITTQGKVVVYYFSTDKAGNVETIKNQTIKIDKTTPSGSIKINNGDTYTTSTSVTLNLNEADIGSGVYQMILIDDGVWDTESWEAYSPTKTWTLTLGDGTKTVYLQIKDKAGLVSNTYSDTIILDTTPPTGSITIDGGANYTKTTSVTLTLSATDVTSGVTEMRFRQDDNLTWTLWEPYAVSKVWTLTTGDGTKTMYVQFRDQAGLISTYLDTIIFDTSPPTGSILIAEGLYTNTISVTLTLSANDETSVVAHMRFRQDDNLIWAPWEPYAVSKAWNLTTGDGEKTVYVQFKDNAELISQSYSNIITLDATPPSGSITIAEGSNYTNTASVTLTLSANDVTSGVAEMCFSNDNVTYTEWQTNATFKSWTLQEGDGNKTVYYQIKDNAGLVSESYYDYIFLDATKPSIGSVSQDPLESQVQPGQNVTVSVEVTDGQSGVREVILQYRYSADGGQTWTAWTNVPMNKIMGDTYEAEISGFIVGIEIEYGIAASDHANNAAIKDNVGQYFVYKVIPEFPTWIAILAMLCVFSVVLLLLRRNRNKRRIPERLQP